MGSSRSTPIKIAPPSWLPYLGPLVAAVVGGLIGQWLQMGFWPVLAGALIGGFAPIVAYRVWKWSHHKREP